jgi:hypothetical protein
LDLISSTIAFNTGQLPANLWSQGSPDSVANTIISNPIGGANCLDTVTTDGGSNLVFPGSCDGLTALTADPLLQPLADNGGPTQTHALGWPSPALDAGTSQGDDMDQRDFFRPRDIPTVANVADGADIGAVEMRDSTPPVDPTLDSPSHDVNVGSKDRTVDITWTGASDEGFGVDGYSFDWTTTPTHVPDQTKDAEESATGTTSPSLPDGNSHWFHLRTVDNAGNWTNTVHLGPFVIDATAPETTFTKVPRKRIETSKARVRVRFAFTASEPSSTFECKLDKKPVAACSSPRVLKVKPGRHRFSVQSTDQLGNTDASPAVHKFRVVKA